MISGRDPGQSLQIWDCPESFGTVGTYVNGLLMERDEMINYGKNIVEVGKK